VNVEVETERGGFVVDLDTEELEPAHVVVDEARDPVGLPRVVASARTGSTVVAVVDAVPPLLISYDAGSTWNESGRGLPPGFAVAISNDDPDLIVYASRNRLHLSSDGGRFWSVLAPELPAIRAIQLV
jgi:hypothetical protein